jgi:hypothetical protein
MSDPRRLVEEGDLGASLLSAARVLDADDARARKIALLGVAASGTAVTAAAIAARVLPKSLGAALLTKSVVVGLVVAMASGGVLVALSHARSGSVATAPHPIAASTPVLAPAATESPTEPIDAPSVPVAPPPATPTVQARAAAPSTVDADPSKPGGAPAVASSAPQSHLADEVASLQQARSELLAGQPGRALATLEAHQKQFPHGLLGIEAEVLRIEALAQSGHTNVAAARARRFVALHPNTPYGVRLQALTGDAPPRDESAKP